MGQLLTAFKGMAPFGAVVVFAWGVYQFYRSIELGFRKPYWEKLLALYEEACSSAALLASTNDEAEWNLARNTFWKLYYGPLCLVEDLGVEEAMVQFGNSLENTAFAERDIKKLSDLALSLAYACRDSIRSDWRVPLKKLRGQKERGT